MFRCRRFWYNTRICHCLRFGLSQFFNMCSKKRGSVSKSNIETRSRNHCSRGKTISVTHFECGSVALVFQHAKRMRRIIQGYYKWMSGSYTVHSRCNPMWFLSVELRQGSGLGASSSCKYPETEGTNQNRHWNHQRWNATNSLERTRLSCWCLYNHKGCTYRAPVKYVTKK